MTRRPVLAAAVTGAVLRVVWAIWATTTPTDPLTDAAAYARAADGFGRFATPTIGAHHSAFYPPGYPLVVSPAAWLGRVTGWWGPYAAGSAVNVVLGTASILLVAALAHRWFGPTAAAVAAWLLAMSPGQVMFTSANLSETLLTAVFLLALVLAERMEADVARRTLLGFGALVGAAALVKSNGLVLLLAPALVLRHGGARRATAWAALGCVVVLVPWTVRNGLQVGVWTPLSTNNASSVCIGNRDGASGGWDQDAAAIADCYEDSPFDDPSVVTQAPPGHRFGTPDEPSWYAAATSKGLRWAVHHPLDELASWPSKLGATFGHPDEALHDGRNQAVDGIGSDTTTSVLRVAAWVWHVAVLGLATVGLVADRRVRGTLPVWGTALASLAFVLGGIGLPRYHHTLAALATVLAAAVVVDISGRLRRAQG